MMKSYSLLVLLVLCALWSPRTAGAEEMPLREMRIEPATTPVLFGQAKLSAEPLTRSKSGDSLQAAYKVDVTPISLASEEGTLTISISNDTLRKLADGQTVDFNGQAVSTAGNHSAVRGTATPSKEHKDTGDLRVHIDSKKGKLIFKTTYHISR